MRYIRAGNQIYKIIKEKKNYFELRDALDIKMKCYTFMPKREQDYKIANTIEELCDEFVCSNEHWINHKYMCPEIEDAINYKDSCEKFSKTPTDLFGAIWTDKGLIYVAKMNDKGELELL